MSQSWENGTQTDEQWTDRWIELNSYDPRAEPNINICKKNPATQKILHRINTHLKNNY